VRRYAVKRLSQTSDENLVLYLLQLVQALKYENFKEIKEGTELNFTDERISSGRFNNGSPFNFRSFIAAVGLGVVSLVEVNGIMRF